MNAQVEHFKDDLAKRVFPFRFRKIGSPYAFLNEVGIIPVLEYIYKGNLLIDVAECLNVSMTVLQTWVDNEGHGAAIEEAETISAEGYLAEGMRKLRQAGNAFELSQAKEMVRNAQFMASKKNKKTYGNTDAALQGAGVSYVFNINGNSSAPAAVKEVLDAIDVVPEDRPRVTLNLLEHLIGVPDEPVIDPDMPIGAMGWGDTLPQTGPFYDADENK
ncbi:MAG: hypothetical protein V4649_19370 [Bacteroidota bacterium]